MAEQELRKPAIELNNVSFSYNDIKALNELSLQVPTGMSFGLLGPNGAGKTTLIRLLVGLLKPKSGSVQLLGLTNKHERNQRVEEAIALVDLWQRRKDSILKLSGGMKQRVSLACTIVHKPPLLFLDEPTVGLDPELRVVFWEHFTTLTKQGTTIIISSHTMDDAARCDRLALMRNGKIIAQGTPGELQQATGKPTATLEDAFLYFISHKDKRDA